MSSRSSSPVSSSRWRRSATPQPLARFADSISRPARVTRRAKRSGRIAASPRPLERVRRGASRSGRSTISAGSKPLWWRSWSRPRRLSASSRSSSGAEHLGVLAPAQDPGDQLARRGVVGLEDRALARRAVGLLRRAQLAVGAEVALDQPGDAVADEDLRRAPDLAQLPVGALAVVAAVEVLGRARSRARPSRRSRPCPGSARGGRRAPPRARARGRSSRTGRRGRRGGRGRPCASRSRRAPSCSR